MFNEEIEEQLKEPSHWDAAVDRFVGISDQIFSQGERLKRKISSYSYAHPLVDPDSRLLFKVTVGALVLVFVVVLCSCQTRREPRAVPVRPSLGMRQPEKKPETLYLKRETTAIKSKESGSHTGSIWADTKPPRELFADPKPGRQGDVVTVLIPEDLQFTPTKPAKSVATNGKGNKSDNKATDDKKPVEGKPDSGANDLAFSDPYLSQAMAELPAQPMKEFKMEVVGVEPTGEIFLRGTREYSNHLGERRQVTVVAKAPKRALTSFELDARQLTGVAVTEDTNGAPSEYSSTGWDPVVSRRVAGFAPDVDAELSSLEAMRGEIATTQKALRDQARALAEERQRILRERERMATAQAAGSQANNSSNSTAGSATPRTGLATANKQSGTKSATSEPSAQ